MTNGDKIRKMTDSELAIYLVACSLMGAIGITDREVAKEIVSSLIKTDSGKADVAKMLDYLKVEVKDDDER